MSVAHAQSVGGHDGANGPSAGNVATLALNWPGATTTGNLAYVWAWWATLAANAGSDDSDQWSVTDEQSNVYTRVAHHNESTHNASGSSGSCQALFVCESITGGASPTVTCTVPSSRPYVRMLMGEYSGSGLRFLDAFTHLGPEGGFAVRPWCRMPPLIVKPGDMVITCIQDIPGSITYSAGDGYTQRATAGIAGDAACQDMLVAGHVRRRELPQHAQNVAANSFGISFVIGEAGSLFARVAG